MIYMYCEFFCADLKFMVPLFQTLELSSSYTPEVSEFMVGSRGLAYTYAYKNWFCVFQEATVMGVDQDSSTVKLRYKEDTLLRLSEKGG